MIDFYHVSKTFDRKSTALHDVSLRIGKGEFVFVTGASGAGKSTFLKLILRQIRPTEGHIVINGRNLATMHRGYIPYFRREIGMVFQDFKLIERMTIFQNLAFILTVLGVPVRDHKQKVFNALRAVGLHQKFNSFPPQLSGGEQQRVAIARALINDPLIVVADEPTGNLDPDLSRDIIQIFINANLRGSTLIVATHDRELIRNAPKRTISLEKGRLVEDRSPTSQRVAEPQRPSFLTWT